VKRILGTLVLVTVILNLAPSAAIAIETTPRAGLFDCMKAKGFSKKGVLVKAFNKNPEQRTSSDWVNSYNFARLFTGYPKCFNKKDVSVMRKYVNTINSICSSNPNWSSVCVLAGGRGPLAWWVYENA
jgi:hypothetical protein